MKKLWTFGDSFTAGHGCKYELTGAFSKENINAYYTKTYKSYIDVNKKIWPEIIADDLNLELINKSKNGMSTESIADTCLKFLIEIGKDDTVILQTSTIGRYDFPFLKEKTLMGYNTNKYKRDDELFNIPNSPYFFKTIFVSTIEKEWDISMKDTLRYINGQEHLNDKELILNEYKYNLIRGFFSEFICTNKYYERAVWRIVELSKLLSFIGIKNYIINETKWPEYLDKPNNLIEMDSNGITGYVSKNRKTIFYDTKGCIDDSHPSYNGHTDIADMIIKFIKNENTNLYNT
jgi:hypothetical protein